MTTFYLILLIFGGNADVNPVLIPEPYETREQCELAARVWDQPAGLVANKMQHRCVAGPVKTTRGKIDPF